MCASQAYFLPIPPMPPTTPYTLPAYLDAFCLVVCGQDCRIPVLTVACRPCIAAYPSPMCAPLCLLLPRLQLPACLPCIAFYIVCPSPFLPTHSQPFLPVQGLWTTLPVPLLPCCLALPHYYPNSHFLIPCLFAFPTLWFWDSCVLRAIPLLPVFDIP